LANLDSGEVGKGNPAAGVVGTDDARPLLLPQGAAEVREALY
jgi:hypothetical protein